MKLWGFLRAGALSGLMLLTLWLAADSARAENGGPLPPEAGGATCQPFASYNCTPEALAQAEAYAAGHRAAPPAVFQCDPFAVGDCPDAPQGASDTIFTLWYGSNQQFGNVGNPQTWINVLGNVSDSDGLASLVYALNGGAPGSLALGPDTRRLASSGDFNVEVALTDTALLSGANQLVLTATDTLANVAVQTVTVNFTSGTAWPLPYLIKWSDPGSISDRVQVVDGRWKKTAGGIRPDSLAYVGYDRALAIGERNTPWTDYEVTVPITVHQVDWAGANNPISVAPGLGLVFRWRGHTNSPVACSQPHCGWLPSGASGWYDWGLNYGAFQIGGSTTLLAVDTSGRKLELGVPYYWKMRVETLPPPSGRAYYRIKVWKTSQPEPSGWDLTGLATGSLASGSLLLVAHHVDATFGDVSIVPRPYANGDPDTAPPAISDIRVARRDTSATILWTTDEPATSRIDYGLSQAYTNQALDTALVQRHAVALTNLTPNTPYHYRITSVDPYDNPASSVDLTFQTVGATSPFSVSNVVSDDFNQCALNTALWSYTDPYQDATFAMQGAFSQDAQARLSVPAGVPHPIGSGAVLVPRLMQPIADTDFDLEVKFDSALSALGQRQGILVQQDSANLLRVEFTVASNATRVYAASVVNGVTTVRVNNASFTSLLTAPLYLRLQRNGNTWSVLRSLNGQSWTQAGSDFSVALAVTQVGTFAANAATTPDGGDAPLHTSQVDYFFNRASPVAPEDGAENTLTVSLVGNGTVVKSPDLPNYACNQSVTLTATPTQGWTFTGWSGDLGGAANPAQVSMTAARTITASFVSIDQRLFLPSVTK